MQVLSRCCDTKVVQRWCRAAGSKVMQRCWCRAGAGAEVKRCSVCLGSAEVIVQVIVEVLLVVQVLVMQVQSRCRFSGAEVAQRWCRAGAEVRGAEIELLILRCKG